MKPKFEIGDYVEFTDAKNNSVQGIISDVVKNPVAMMYKIVWDGDGVDYSFCYNWEFKLSDFQEKINERIK